MYKHALTITVLALAACSTDGTGGDDQPDPPCDTKFYPDFDRDGYGDESQDSCEQQQGFITQGGDCVDNDPHIHPEAVELCDSTDNNCSGEADEATAELPGSQGHLFYRDADGDGFGGATSMRACIAPAGFVMNNTDCNDTASSIHPNATEVCDSIDNDCDLQIDTADASLDTSSATVYYRDADSDTYGGTQTMTACTRPSGYVALAGDCNDSDNTSRPGLAELCDGRDNDCDGGVDGTVALPNQCAGLTGAYAGTYSHLTQEKLGQTVINSMSCSGTGTATLALNRAIGQAALQGTYTCIYSGGLGGFLQNQSVTLKANVTLAGVVTGTIEHTYDSFGQKRTYTIAGTQTGSTLTLMGMGSWLPHPMSAVPWTVSFSMGGTN
ncbi:MAG: putative metal-binding motif-containing protein [Kofleriaceae bacterium]